LNQRDLAANRDPGIGDEFVTLQYPEVALVFLDRVMLLLFPVGFVHLPPLSFFKRSVDLVDVFDEAVAIDFLETVPLRRQRLAGTLGG